MHLKDNLQNIIDGKFDGKFDDKFSPEQIKMMLEMSFLYNHIRFEIDAIVFEYNGVTFKASGINDMIHSMPYTMAEDEILSIIRNDSVLNRLMLCF